MDNKQEQGNNGRGKNILEEAKSKSAVQAFLEQLNDPLIFILFIAAAISMLLREFSDTIIILAVIFLNAIIGVIQEGKAKRALEALKKLTSPIAIVIRNKEQIEISAKDLVVGDIVYLDAGRQVPADLKLLTTNSLKIEESALTGESLPVEKDIRIENKAYMSTNVTYGRGEGVVTAIGMDTKIGKIAKLINDAPSETTPLQKRLADLGKVLSVVSIFLCAALFLIAVWQKRDIMEMLITAISLAVAAVPEGLPAIVTMVLALSVSRMVKVNTIVKRLPSVETLGSVSVVCSDKTGTLTQNKMTVTSCYLNGRIYDVASLNSMQDKQFIQGFTLCNDAMVSDHNRIGDPTELALLDMAFKYGLTKNKLEKFLPRKGEIGFDSERKMMTTLHLENGRYVSYTKGSLEEILKHSTKIMINDSIVTLSQNHIKTINEAADKLSKRALRLLALGMKSGENRPSESDLIFIGMVGMMDPIRPEAKEAVEDISKAGVRTVMITGDRMDTAFAIAKELGIADKISQCMSGEEMDKIADQAFSAVLKHTNVFAHVSPEHKVRIVKTLKMGGEIVAMTGDGVNDAPSLKSADVGIAMGITGTDVAKGAADLVLTDDNFATIAKAIAEGRSIYENIKKSVLFLLSSNFGEIIMMLIAIILGFSSPLKSSHILWINLITDSLPALALGIDINNSKSFMEKPPRQKKESLFANGGLKLTLFYGLLIAFISMTAFLQIPIGILRAHNMPVTINNLGELLLNAKILGHAQTYAFTVLGISQLFHAIGMRDVNKSIFRMNHFKNKFMIAAFAVGLLLQLMVTEIPYFVKAFGTYQLTLQEWGMLISLSAMPLLAHEIMILFGNSKRPTKKL